MKVHASGTFFDTRVTLIHSMRKAGNDLPLGTWDSDHVWTPDPQEHQPCCDELLTQECINSFRLFTHCKSRKHIANLVASRYEQNYYPEYEGKEGENTVYSYSPTGEIRLSIHP